MQKKEIFVFGSNLAGIHGAGSAAYAHVHKGAQWGLGQGFHGESYAIPTKCKRLHSLPLEKIALYVDIFKDFAGKHPEMLFKVVAIGCGLAGYKPAQIGPMFKNCPSNVILPDVFLPFAHHDSSRDGNSQQVDQE